ncbi:MAG TPA: hypothetical protein VM308_09725 [Sphingomicrobium sp.]|nr:hypothetical protein [Sphingomicrobium sp.]
MPASLASLRIPARGLAAAAALALSAITLTATAGPAHASQAESADRFHFVLFSSGDSSSMNGTNDDYSRARAMRRGSEPLLYFRQNGAAYVIRDPATLARADALMKPQRELGARQSALGREQSALGRQQAALGAEQGRIGRMMADATARQMAELGRQQSALGRQQSALGAQQSTLGKQQGELGREQSRLAGLAAAQLRTLVAEALQRGLAQRVD